MPFDFFFPKTPQGAPAEMVTCPKCKHRVPRANHCQDCGTVLPAPRIGRSPRCSQCKAIVEKGATACSECGFGPINKEE